MFLYTQLGGILMQYTTNGLNYIIGMAEKATVTLMKDFPIPDSDGSGYSVTKVKVNSFDPPKYTVRILFVCKKLGKKERKSTMNIDFRPVSATNQASLST